MRIFITGGTGLVGQRLTPHLLREGHDVVILTRDADSALDRLSPDERLFLVEGDGMNAGEWQKSVDGCDAVINLAGAGIADKRWSDDYKNLIVQSRLMTTRHVVGAIESASQRPAVLVSASAVGIYPDAGDNVIDESSPRADNFFGRLAAQWEAVANEACKHGVRVVTPRISMVLDAAGGSLAMMLTPFRLGVGGRLGSGRQYMPWIHWRDLIGIIDFALHKESLEGPINAAAPNPVTNAEFTKALGRILKRPTVLPVPKFALKIVLGELAEFVTMSQRVMPMRARAVGYQFQHPELEPALRSMLA